MPVKPLRRPPATIPDDSGENEEHEGDQSKWSSANRIESTNTQANRDLKCIRIDLCVVPLQSFPMTAAKIKKNKKKMAILIKRSPAMKTTIMMTCRS